MEDHLVFRDRPREPFVVETERTPKFSCNVKGIFGYITDIAVMGEA
jgi:hypothetical protein